MSVSPLLCKKLILIRYAFASSKTHIPVRKCSNKIIIKDSRTSVQSASSFQKSEQTNSRRSTQKYPFCVDDFFYLHTYVCVFINKRRNSYFRISFKSGFTEIFAKKLNGKDNRFMEDRKWQAMWQVSVEIAYHF